MSDEPSEQVEVPVQMEGRWVGVDDLPAILVNQMLGQVHEGEIVLTFGYVSPPAIVGAERLTEWARQTEFVEIKPVARIALTPQKLRDIATVLNDTIANYERQEARRRGDVAPEGESS
jgi:hypothetical protein